jgi:Zn-finger nucleic acid-binding protein
MLHCDVCGVESRNLTKVKSNKSMELCPECLEMWKDWSRLERHVFCSKKAGGE